MEEEIVTLICMVVSIIITVIYFTPFLIASIRKPEREFLIFIFNLLFGWTIIGWVLTLWWSLKEEKIGSEE